MSLFRHRATQLFILVLLIGSAARYILPLRGHNFDYESYQIVAQLVRAGENVYANTARFNYGPIWFWILGACSALADFFPASDIVFRYAIVTVIMLPDIAIFSILSWRFGLLVGSLFYLNPISIIITGYHNQFDNLAILLGIVAMLVLGSTLDDRRMSSRKWLALVLLGLSLSTKHIFIFLPIWLALKQPGLRQKLLVAAIPLVVFAATFAPYVQAGADGIMSNVILYDSHHNELFYSQFVPPLVQKFANSTLVWVALLGLVGLYTRPVDPFRALLIYTCIFVAAAPATANQYLAIPLAYVAVYMNWGLALYALVGSIYLVMTKNGLHLAPDYTSLKIFGTICIFFLSLGFLWAQFRSTARQFALWLWSELRMQFE